MARRHQDLSTFLFGEGSPDACWLFHPQCVVTAQLHHRALPAHCLRPGLAPQAGAPLFSIRRKEPCAVFPPTRSRILPRTQIEVGLPLAYRLMTSMGGGMTIASSRRFGTRVQVMLAPVSAMVRPA